jgi:PAS domain S-box-containing protein
MRILHLEDNLADAEAARRQILAAWPDAEIVLCGDASKLGLLLLRSADFDIILSETRIAGADGRASLELAKQLSPGTPFLFLAAASNPEDGVHAVRGGAADHVPKSQILLLAPAIERILAGREERKRARQLEKQCASQARMLDRTSDVIIVEDPNGRVTFWNHAAEKALGWTPVEANGRILETFACDEARSELSAGVRAAVEKGEWRGEIKLRAKAGHCVALEVRRILVRDPEGRPESQLTIGCDLTERRELEEQFHRSQRMECVSSLAAGMAHDLNNVLTPLTMALGLLKKDLRAPAQIRLMTTLQKSADRGASLVRQMLAFLQGSSPHEHLLNAADAVREVGSIVKATFPANIAIVEDIPADLWPFKARETHLHQVLLNLAVNARDAMPAGGKLTFSAGNVTLGEEEIRRIPQARAGKFVVLSVADTGTGVRPEDRERIWEPFFTTKPEGKGTGLGLPTVRGIVSRYNGFIDMESTVGAGTRFRIHFPAAPDEAPGDAKPEEPSAEPCAAETVLVIDQSLEVRNLTLAVLARYGYQTAAVSDGLEGAALFQREGARFSVVVSELRAPGLGGARLASALRKLSPGVRLVFTGSGASDADAAEARAIGALLVIKPFQPNELLFAVMSAMRQGEHADVT